MIDACAIVIALALGLACLWHAHAPSRIRKSGGFQ